MHLDMLISLLFGSVVINALIIFVVLYSITALVLFIMTLLRMLDLNRHRNIEFRIIDLIMPARYLAKLLTCKVKFWKQ